MINKLKRQLVRHRNKSIYSFYALKAKLSSKVLPINPDANFVVSIASYPKRDPLLPAVFQALSRQTLVPKKWILVLSEEDYLNDLPTHLQKLEKRGIEILWVKDNPYAVKKLMPTMDKYPKLDVVTLDDDIIYHKSLLSGLLEKVNKNKSTIVGYIGKSLIKKEGKLNMYYREKYPANLNTPSIQVFLIGWGGIYYPAGSLDNRVLDLNAVHEIVPGRGSDIWFWAAAVASNTKQICLGAPHYYNLGIPIPANERTQPKDQPKTDVLLDRFQKTIDYFGIREKLIKNLPEKSK